MLEFKWNFNAGFEFSEPKKKTVCSRSDYGFKKKWPKIHIEKLKCFESPTQFSSVNWCW